MRVLPVCVVTLSALLSGTSWIAMAKAQSNTPLDQITVSAEQGSSDKKKNSKNQYEGTILETPSIGAPGISISKQDLEILNPGDLQDVFLNETAVSVGGSTPVSQKIYVYGLEDSQLAVSIDGARQSSATFHHAGSLLIDPSLLKAARVDPGVAPADAGPGALGGSIQLETVDVKDLLEPGKSVGGFIVSTFDVNSKTISIGASAYTQSNGFEALGYYKFLDGDNWEDGNGVEQNATAASLKTALGKLAYEAQSGDRFEVSYEWINDDAIRPYRANLGNVIRPGRTYPNQSYDLSRKTFVFNYSDEKPNGWWDPKLTLSYNDTKLDSFPEYGSFGYIETLSGKFENNFAMSLGDINAGVDFFRSEASGGDGALNDTGTEKDNNIGIYAQARLKPIENARLSFGGRIDRQDFTGVDGTEIENTGFSGNVGAEYDINEILTLKAAYAHVFGRIPLAEAMLNSTDYTYDGLDSFDSTNFTTGISAKYNGFTFDANYIKTVMDDSIAYYAQRGNPSRNYTVDIESEGFDLAVGYKWDTGFIKAKYSNIDVTSDDGPIGTTAFYWGTNIGELITLQANHKFAGTGVTIGADMQIALEQDDVIDAGDQPLPSYEVVNAFIQYEPKSMPKLTLRAEVNNVFDEAYADRATSGQEYGSFIVPLYEPGRSVYLSAKAKF